MERSPKKYIWVLPAGLMMIIGYRAWAGTQQPVWTIGRAVVVEQQSRESGVPPLYLKLSLRNVGVPGRVPVRIYARWVMANQNRKWGHSEWPLSTENRAHTASGRWSMPKTDTLHHNIRTLPPGMRLLGQYTREVSMNRTVILQVNLAGLGAPRRNTSGLKVVVMTALNVTDDRIIRLMRARHREGSKY